MAATVPARRRQGRAGPGPPPPGLASPASTRWGPRLGSAAFTAAHRRLDSDLRAFVRPIAACAPQVLRGIKAQAMAARGGASWTAHRQVEREHFVRTWLHDDHWAAADKLLSKGT